MFLLFYLFALSVVWVVVGIVCVLVGMALGFNSKVKWGLFTLGPLLVLAALVAVSWWNSPTTPSRGEILGKYEIDQSFHPGKNAEWQDQTYSMTIRRNELTLHDSRTSTIWRYPIEWSGTKGSFLWGFADDEIRHHLVRNGPTLYRHKFHHTYVFTSPLYGEVRFRRKLKGGFWLWGVVGGLGLSGSLVVG